MKEGKRKKIHVSEATTGMVEDILGSNLRPVEKLFLSLEWFLREESPFELLGDDLKNVRENAHTFMRRKIPADLCLTALKEAQDIFHANDEQEAFSALLGLSYYSYVDNEFVYDHKTKKGLLSKLVEVGISPSKIKSLNSKWKRITGSSEDLFNKIFQK